MNRRCASLALASLVAIAGPLRAEDPPLPDGARRAPVQSSTQVLPWGDPLSFPSVRLPDPFTQVNDKTSAEDGESSKAPASHIGPKKHIRDNAFLVEESINQEPGVVQHIFNWVNQWDRTPGARTRDFLATYTMELPLGTQTHQFSFTTQFLTAFQKPNDGPAVQQGDIGDTFLNYRYQLLADDDFLWCAPRFSLIVPTGDKRFGSGTGELGYFFNLPITRYGDRFDFHFNAGTTLVPHVSLPLPSGALSPRYDLRAYNLGASTFWKPRTNLHFFVEALGLWNEEIDEVGFRRGVIQAFVNPGVRYAICQREEVEWVVGVSVPVGLTPDSPDIGVFAYMSVEHAFRTVNGGGGK